MTESKNPYRTAFLAVLNGECPGELYPVEGSPNCDHCDSGNVCWTEWFVEQEREEA